MKAIRLELRDGRIVATAFDHIAYPRTTTEGGPDPEGYPGKALTLFLARNKVRHEGVATSVPGARGLVRFLRLPPVDENMLGELARFEARQIIPFPLEEVTWDWQKLRGEVGNGVDHGPEVGLFAIKKNTLEEGLAPFQTAGIQVPIVQLAPLALINFLAPQIPLGQEELWYCGLDIGAGYTSLVLTDGSQRMGQRPLPIAGDDFTRALADAFRLPFAEAEQLKCSAGQSSDHKRIRQALQPVFHDLGREVRRVLDFFSKAHPQARLVGVVGLGNGFRVPGLQRLLAEKLQLPVLWGEQTTSPGGR